MQSGDKLSIEDLRLEGELGSLRQEVEHRKFYGETLYKEINRHMNEIPTHVKATHDGWMCNKNMHARMHFQGLSYSSWLTAPARCHHRKNLQGLGKHPKKADKTTEKRDNDVGAAQLS